MWKFEGERKRAERPPEGSPVTCGRPTTLGRRPPHNCSTSYNRNDNTAVRHGPRRRGDHADAGEIVHCWPRGYCVIFSLCPASVARQSDMATPCAPRPIDKQHGDGVVGAHEGCDQEHPVRPATSMLPRVSSGGAFGRTAANPQDICLLRLEPWRL